MWPCFLAAQEPNTVGGNAGGGLEVSSPVIFSDNRNNDGFANPGERVRFGFTLTNNTDIVIELLEITSEVGSNAIQLAGLSPGETYTVSYDNGQFLDFFLSDLFAETTYTVPLTLTCQNPDTTWWDWLTFPVEGMPTPYSSTAVVHERGMAEWEFDVVIVDQSAVKNHTYQITIVDSIDEAGTQGYTLRDITDQQTLLFNHPLPDVDGFSSPIIDGLRIGRGALFGLLGFRQDSTRWISPNDIWFRGFRFDGNPKSGLNGGVVLGSELEDWLSHVSPSFPPSRSKAVEIRFNALEPQKAYRLRRTGGISTSYVIQASNPFTEVPFSAWDVSGPIARQLTVAWRDQNDNGMFDPQTGDDAFEVVFIYDRSYDSSGGQWPYEGEGSDSLIWSDACTVGRDADIMYGVSIAVLPGHSMSESAGTLYIRPYYGLTSEDRYVFNPIGVASSPDLLQPLDFALHQNYPNPFNPSTHISFHLPVRSSVSLSIYDLSGRQVAVLASGDYSAGSYKATWIADRAASGVYFCRLVAKTGAGRQQTGFVATRKLLLLR